MTTQNTLSYEEQNAANKRQAENTDLGALMEDIQRTRKLDYACPRNNISMKHDDEEGYLVEMQSPI
jgi:hypothetical protein